MKYLTHELGYAIGRAYYSTILHFLIGVKIITTLVKK